MIFIIHFDISEQNFKLHNWEEKIAWYMSEKSYKSICIKVDDFIFSVICHEL